MVLCVGGGHGKDRIFVEFRKCRKLVGLQSPAACATRLGGDSGSNFENYDFFHAQSLDPGRGVRASSRRANQDFDIRR